MLRAFQLSLNPSVTLFLGLTVCTNSTELMTEIEPIANHDQTAQERDKKGIAK